MIVAVFTLSSVQMINSIKSVIHDSCTGHPLSHKRIEKMRDHPESGFFLLFCLDHGVALYITMSSTY